MQLVRYSILLTDEDLKVLYKIFDENHEAVGNIILQSSESDEILTSIILFREIEINSLGQFLELAKMDFEGVKAITKKKNPSTLSELLKESVIRLPPRQH